MTCQVKQMILILLQYYVSIRPIMVCLCSNTLVCDSIEEARDLAFGRSERHKVAASDGTLFFKSGNITGGLARDIEQRAQRWDDNDLAKLKQVHHPQHLACCKCSHQWERCKLHAMYQRCITASLCQS